jgi:hypothetical protein
VTFWKETLFIIFVVRAGKVLQSPNFPAFFIGSFLALQRNWYQAYIPLLTPLLHSPTMVTPASSRSRGKNGTQSKAGLAENKRLLTEVLGKGRQLTSKPKNERGFSGSPPDKKSRDNNSSSPMEISPDEVNADMLVTPHEDQEATTSPHTAWMIPMILMRSMR